MIASPAAGGPNRLLPHHAHIPTSRANAHRTTLKKDIHRMAVLAHLGMRGAFGATRAELSRATRIPIQSICPLVVWMRDTLQEIEQTEARRDGGYTLVLSRAPVASNG